MNLIPSSGVADAQASKPRPDPRQWLHRNLPLMGTVIIPTLLAVIYFGMVASDAFISESRFVVRTPQRNQQPGLVGALLQGSAFTRAQDDAFTVHDYILSRDALKELEAPLNLRKSFGSKDIDFVNRFPQMGQDESFETLFKYYSKHVVVDHDPTTSITTLRVTAYSPKLAHEMNERLLQLGERLINRINERARVDLVKYASDEVAEAEEKAKTAAGALAGFRNDRGVFDPDRQSAIQLQLISKLQDELIATRTQLVQMRSLSPDNPQLKTLTQRTKLIKDEIDKEMGKVAGNASGSLTSKASKYERFVLERTFADRQLASALSTLEAARNEARRKQLYLERIVSPNQPDLAAEPRRLRSILIVFVLGLITWGIVSLFRSSLREHVD